MNRVSNTRQIAKMKIKTKNTLTDDFREATRRSSDLEDYRYKLQNGQHDNSRLLIYSYSIMGLDGSYLRRQDAKYGFVYRVYHREKAVVKPLYAISLSNCCLGSLSMSLNNLFRLFIWYSSFSLLFSSIWEIHSHLDCIKDASMNKTNRIFALVTKIQRRLVASYRNSSTQLTQSHH